jgi:Uma2 family endonuclease
MTPSTLDPPRKHWTRPEYDELCLLNGQRMELIDGQLIDKMGKKRPHVNSLVLLQGWLIEVSE